MKTVLVTGASGFVGSRLVQRWSSEFRLLAPSRFELDITDRCSVKGYFMRNSPDMVLHLAAISNTWYCQQRPEESYMVNVEGVCNMAEAAATYGAKFLFFSSDQVYNGNCESGPLPENIEVMPENVYGRHKLEAERRAMEIYSGTVALRATWMYDARCDGLPQHADFVQNIAAAVEQRKPIAFPVREHRGITWVREAVEYLPVAFRLPGGVYNYGAGNSMNTYETACCYCEMLAGLQAGALLQPDYERYKLHERNLTMDTGKIFRASGGAILFSSTIDGLRLFHSMQ